MHEFKKGTLDRKEQHSLRMMAEILKDINPVAYQACINMHNPELEDWNLLIGVKDILLRQYPLNIENCPIYLGVIYRLYAPWKLHKTAPKLPVGFRDTIQETLELTSSEMVNYHSEFIIVKYKNKRWSNNIDQLAGDIIYEFKTNGISCDQTVTRPLNKISVPKKLPRKLKKQLNRSIWK
jgi:hypothetical protein